MEILTYRLQLRCVNQLERDGMTKMETVGLHILPNNRKLTLPINRVTLDFEEQLRNM